jgi:hypothetical protein
MIKFNKYNVTNGETKAKVSYSINEILDGRKCVTLYAKDYDRSLGKIFKDEYVNDTDSMTDYFDKGRVRIFESSKLYSEALKRASSIQEKLNSKYSLRK